MFKFININIVLKVISRNLFITSAALILCMFIAFLYSEDVIPFIISFAVSFGIGITMFLKSRKLGKNVKIERREAYLTVTLSWLFISLIGALPYIFSGAIPRFTNAFFESVSGFTTTGSSILTDIESLPYSILFWRSLTHWIGGIGIIVLVIVVMPSLQIGGYQLFTLESSLQEKILPKIKTIGHRLLLIYILLTVAEVILLLYGNMNFFESVCHAFGTVATGGFSPKNTSIANYSPYIQYVVMIFMVLAGTNFIVHYYLLKLKFKDIKKNEEFKLYLLLIGIIGGAITLILHFKMNQPFESAFRDSFFQVISIVTCTGYATADYMLWPQYAWITIFMIMFLGGSTGSTAGGIKMARHLVLFKNISRIIRQLAAPNAIIPLKINKKMIPEETNNSIMTFITVYILVFILGNIVLLILGIDGQTAISSVATTMAGIGPGLGSVGPAGNFSHLPDSAKLVLSFLMLIGRLEIYTVFVLFTRNFWMK